MVDVFRINLSGFNRMVLCKWIRNIVFARLHSHHCSHTMVAARLHSHTRACHLGAFFHFDNTQRHNRQRHNRQWQNGQWHNRQRLHAQQNKTSLYRSRNNALRNDALRIGDLRRAPTFFKQNIRIKRCIINYNVGLIRWLYLHLSIKQGQRPSKLVRI